MSDALFRIPSRTVKYGYIDLHVASDVPIEMLAAQYVNYVYAFQKEEEASIERLKGEAAAWDASSGAVKAPLAAPEPTPEEVAKQAIIEGLGPVTELPEGEPHPATEPTDEPPTKAAPWEAEVATPKKPWETEAEKPNRPVHPIVTPDW